MNRFGLHLPIRALILNIVIYKLTKYFEATKLENQKIARYDQSNHT